MAQDSPFHVAKGVFCEADSSALGLKMAAGTETFTVFQPSEDNDKYNNGAVLTCFKDTLFCMWQSSARDEDAADTHVVYSKSGDNGRTWTAPEMLCRVANGYCTSGGWAANEDSLVAFINVWSSETGGKPQGNAFYMTSVDGTVWGQLHPVLMADGTPIDGILEQDPHRLPSGRTVGAAHFNPRLTAIPIYTDDPKGINGWTKGLLSDGERGSFAMPNTIEPSLFCQRDGSVVMVFRDQNSSFRKWAAVSRDGGEHWTEPATTDFPDSRSKQSAGNLPDGTAYFVSNPVGYKYRAPLVLTLSDDTYCFRRAFILRRGGSELPPRRYEGRFKTVGYSYPKTIVTDGFLFTSYSTNKEKIEVTRVPLSAISVR